MRTVPEIDRAQLPRFKELILRTCGFHLENEREASLCTALRERLSALGLRTLEAYFEAVAADPVEFGHFVERLTVNETYFMREPSHLRLLDQHLVPEILADRPGPVRLLSAGCSCGEEPYSMAILLRERYGDACEQLFTISGVDIDAAAIAKARRGRYGRSSFRGMDPELVTRHFETTEPGQLHLREATSRLAGFETVNLLNQAFPPCMQRQDIILYRNVSIYFPRSVQQEVFAHLAGLLNEQGYLIVGATETMHHDLGILSLVEREGLYVFQKQAVHRDHRNPRRRPERTTLVGEVPQPTEVRSSRPHPPAVQHTVSRDLKRRFDDALGQARLDRNEEALGIIEELLGRDPSFLKALALKASLLMAANQYEEARAACEQALQKDALCLEACLVLGILARRDGDDDAAHRRFREALYLDGNCWLAHYYLAEILTLKQDTRRARAGYGSALRILENDTLLKRGRSLFPLSFNARQFITICRHKLSLSKENA